MSYSSYKWISNDERSSNPNTLTVHNIDRSVFGGVGANECNLISIFGRARQGKSFLMNCLAGERDIFRISNEKESCTQGIDISNKWLSLLDFSRIDSGRAVSGKIKVGFVDAEGQGDKDISYDANLICPILLASKCVIFNWKGDLQKDHILSTLGVMTRAAQSVGVDGEGDSEANFGHLHIVFRDWQAVNTNANSTFKALFEMENTVAGATRDQIRADVLKSFASIRVWLMDAPSDSVQALKSKLTFDKTSVTFKAQLRDLRNALSDQLRTPTILGGGPLSGKTIMPMTRLIVDSLNAGEVVRPVSAYMSMMAQEIDVLRQAHEMALRAEMNGLLEDLKADVNQPSTQHRLRIEYSQEQATIIVEEHLRSVNENYEVVLEQALGSSTSAALSKDILKLSKYRESIERCQIDSINFFLAQYSTIHAELQHNATKIELFLSRRSAAAKLFVEEAERGFKEAASRTVQAGFLQLPPLDYWSPAMLAGAGSGRDRSVLTSPGGVAAATSGSGAGQKQRAAEQLQEEYLSRASQQIVTKLTVIIDEQRVFCCKKLQHWVTDKANIEGITFTKHFFKSAGKEESFRSTMSDGPYSAITLINEEVHNSLIIIADELRKALLANMKQKLVEAWEEFQREAYEEQERVRRKAAQQAAEAVARAKAAAELQAAARAAEEQRRLDALEALRRQQREEEERRKREQQEEERLKREREAAEIERRRRQEAEDEEERRRIEEETRDDVMVSDDDDDEDYDFDDEDLQSINEWVSGAGAGPLTAEGRSSSSSSSRAPARRVSGGGRNSNSSTSCALPRSTDTAAEAMAKAEAWATAKYGTGVLGKKKAKAALAVLAAKKKRDAAQQQQSAAVIGRSGGGGKSVAQQQADALAYAKNTLGLTDAQLRNEDGHSPLQNKKRKSLDTTEEAAAEISASNKNKKVKKLTAKEQLAEAKEEAKRELQERQNAAAEAVASHAGLSPPPPAKGARGKANVGKTVAAVVKKEEEEEEEVEEEEPAPPSPPPPPAAAAASNAKLTKKELLAQAKEEAKRAIEERAAAAADKASSSSSSSGAKKKGKK